MNKQKDDNGKLRWDLLPLDVVEKLVEIYEFGANKYEENSWRTIENGYKRCRAALFRHLTAYDKGERVDPESGKSHLAHAAWNALSMVYFAEKSNISTDEGNLRGKKGDSEKNLLSAKRKPIDKDFETGALLYVETVDKHHCLIRNIVGKRLFSLTFLYYISEPIVELKLTRLIRLANDYEKGIYESFRQITI